MARTTDSDEHTVEARTGAVFSVAARSQIEIVDIAGGQVVDTWAFSQKDIGEYHSAEHTRTHLSKLFPGIGETFVTNRRRPILELVDDRSPGVHDLLIAACDPTRYAQLGVSGWHASCQENLLNAMRGIGYSNVEVPQPINVFMNTPADEHQRIAWLPTLTRPGDSITLRALMDLHLVVSACPQDVTGINRVPGPIMIRISPAE